jgi:hypothetical protein
MAQMQTPRADGLRKMREDNWKAEQDRQAEERRAAAAAAPKPAAIARAAKGGAVTGNVPVKRTAKKTRPQAKAKR